MTKRSHKVKYLFILFIALLLLGSAFFFYHKDIKNDFNSRELQHFQKVYNQKEKELNEKVDELFQWVKNEQNEQTLFQLVQQKTQTLKHHGFSFFIYKNEELISWTDNKLYITPRFKSDDEIALLKNGWYRKKSMKKDSVYIIGAFLIKNEFPYENKDLVNRFHPDFDFHYEGIIEKTTQPGFVISGALEETSFSLIPTRKIPVSIAFELFILALFVFGMIGLVWTLIVYFKSTFFSLFVIFLLVFLRYLQLLYFPQFLSELQIFQPDIFASSEWFPSFGDLVINTMVSVFTLVVLMRSLIIKRNKKKSLKLLQVIFTSAVLIFWGFYTNFIINNLIENSNIHFQLDQFFELNTLSFTGLFLIGGYFFVFIFISSSVIRSFRVLPFKLNKLFVVIFLLFVIALFFVDNTLQLYEVLWPFLVLMVVGWMEIRFDKSYSFAGILVLLLIISGYTSFLISHLNFEKEQNNRIAYAERLVTDEDPLTEIEYDRIGGQIKISPFLQKLYFDSLFLSKSEIDSKIENLYFSKYWEKYELSFYYFDTDSMPVDVRVGKNKSDFETLSNLKDKKGIPSKINPHIFFIPDFSQQINYIISQPIEYNDSLIGHFYASLRSKKIPEQIGFPKLMLDKNTKTIEELSDYSVSRYTSGKLVTRYGDFNYPMNDSIWRKLDPKSSVFFDFEGFNHLIYNINEKSLAVISTPQSGLYSAVTSFSYIFTYFGLLLMVFYFVRNFPEGVKVANYSLNAKIQLLSISLVIITLIAFVYGSGIYLRDQYLEKSVNQFKEKVRSVELEVAQKLSKEDEFNTFLKNYSEGVLQKLSNVFNTDINLYNLEGQLFASSRPKMFSVGLLSPIINPQAYNAVIIDNKSEYIHSESIGKLDYLSAYTPLINENGKLLGYLNLQYFSKQNELENEMASLIVAIVNIFVLLFAISVVSTIFVSNWMTQPIKVIRRSLRRIELGKKNEIIAYSGNDEIGDLVKEYNQKVAELEKNAEQLAKSERESAWREMAKQVAHEIKNPLTPMKLSIQHLQRTFDPTDPKAEDKIKSVTDSLVEQIDGLTHIANAFSNFAKLPQPQNEKVDLVLLLQSCVQLHQNKKQVDISFNSAVESAEVFMDKNLMTRVFNNLIINAVQSIPEERHGAIKVLLELEKNQFVVKIIDNGTGVDEAVKDKIFSPNFTTKSTGTGLGLAMVKNIIESYNGSVEFISKTNEGSIFKITLHK